MLASSCPKTSKYSPFFDQKPPRADVVGLIASLDLSDKDAVVAMAVFKTRNGFLSVQVYGPKAPTKVLKTAKPFKIWPSPGAGVTHQVVFRTIDEVEESFLGHHCWAPLLEVCRKRCWHF